MQHEVSATANLAGSAKLRPSEILAADSVVLVCRQGDYGQDAQDGDDDHQFDQGKTFLDCFHCLKLQFESVNNYV